MPLVVFAGPVGAGSAVAVVWLASVGGAAMTTNRSRIDRGKQTQLIVARYYARNGWPYAEPVGSGRNGTDVTGMPGLLVEVKAEAGWRPTTWLRQHDGCPVPYWAFQRPNGYGEATIGNWPVIMTADWHTWLLHQAGFGTGEDGR